MRKFHRLFSFVILSLLLVLAGESTVAAPAALSMTVSDPYCVQSAPKSGICTINVRSFSASTPDSTFSRIEISINGKVRLRMQSFFESSAYLNEAMLGPGLKVPCGRPNSSGVPGFGKVYSVQLTGYTTTGSPVTDIANVTCPYYEGKNFLPSVQR